MTRKRKNKCTIHDEELSQWLGITLERLDKVVEFFDSDPHDDWDLVESEDYIFFNRRYKQRRFAPKGALKIAAYLDQNEQRSILYKIREFITQHDNRLRKSLAKQLIYSELLGEGKIVNHNNHSMMHKQSLRRILETSGSRFNQSFRELQRSQMPLQPDVDFAEIENELWFSGSGSVRIAKDLGEKLTNKSRRKMCQVVGTRLTPVLKQIEDEKTRRVRQIEQAKQAAKKRDKNTCQITKTKPSRNDKFNLSAHHLYSAKSYPHLATNLDNLISIREEIHKEFHTWMGGYDKKCTIDDFIEFIHSNYPDNDEISFVLHQRKLALRAD